MTRGRHAVKSEPVWSPWFFLASLSMLLANSVFSMDKQVLATSPHEFNREVVRKTYLAHLEKHKGDPDILVLPGLLAHRRQKWIKLQTEMTGLASDTPVEFVLVSESSGHDYEALALSWAKPSDIHRALEFIGMKAGYPSNPEEFRFWPKGERVHVTVEIVEDRALGGMPHAVPAEKLILDTRTQEPLPSLGWVFVGSQWLASDTITNGQNYAADSRDPSSIISLFNEPFTVLDLPKIAIQADVYGYQVVNPAYSFPPGRLVNMVLRPEHEDGSLRVLDLELTVRVQEGVSDTELSDMRFSLKTLDGEQLHQGYRLESVLAAFGHMTQQGKELYLNFHPDLHLSLVGLRTLYAFFDTLNNEKGIRIEPPPRGHLYYKAFLPNEDYRDMSKRPSQPWELHLFNTEGKTMGRLKKVNKIWASGKAPQFEVHEIPAPDAETLKNVWVSSSPRLPVLLIFAPPDMTYGELLAFVQPVMDTHPTLYIFLSSAAAKS